MWKLVPFCDVCGQQIPTETTTDDFGHKRTVARVGMVHPFCNEIKMSLNELMACECCADKINASLIKAKYEALMEAKQ